MWIFEYLTTDKVDEINVDLNELNTVEILCLNVTYYRGGCAVWVKNNISFKQICSDNFSTDNDLEVSGLSFNNLINGCRNKKCFCYYSADLLFGLKKHFFAEIYYYVVILINRSKMRQ